MKVKAGARRFRWDPPSPEGGAHHRPVSPATSGRWSKSACDGTRKMVNYAWAGRSQRKLWWRPAVGPDVQIGRPTWGIGAKD